MKAAAVVLVLLLPAGVGAAIPGIPNIPGMPNLPGPPIPFPGGGGNDGKEDGSDGPEGWPGGVPDSLEDPACIRMAAGIDLAVCSAVGAVGGAGGGSGMDELSKLEQIRCVVNAINKWQHDRMECLEGQVNRRLKTIVFPKKVLEPLGMGLKAVQGLRDEVRDMVCRWRLTPRMSVFRDMYLKPFRWCKSEYELIFGRADNFANASDHEVAKWLGVTTQNLLSNRTGGVADHSPEATWLYTATSVSRTHLDNANSPGEAVRFMATTMADDLRVNNNTLQLQAQQMLVEETRRGLRLKRQRELDAFSAFLTASVAGLDQPGRAPHYEELP